ncbi:hypothetical protein W02_22190 [Nitrospira sp. KM1]|uniref:hypothetical protein n=1 Tax=Nitrospira sp. KM1 TaxID=1936990 RepID=UPI0013A7AF53|nr:hypothetical protein [Nitrospira sp. KM1]BCA55079.1 hypothetical protein W02_22190 [Nitrospira sp. KM1]
MNHCDITGSTNNHWISKGDINAEMGNYGTVIAHATLNQSPQNRALFTQIERLYRAGLRHSVQGVIC